REIAPANPQAQAYEPRVDPRRDGDARPPSPPRPCAPPDARGEARAKGEGQGEGAGERHREGRHEADQESGEGRGDPAERGQVSGPENASLRVPARDREAVALALLRAPQLPGALEGRRPDPEVPENEAAARGDRRRAHRAQA